MTLLEVVISTAIASLLMGAVWLGFISLQWSLKGSQTYAELHASNQRVLDSLGTDIRNAVAIGTASTSGSFTALLSGSVALIPTSGTLVIKTPTFYMSTDPTAAPTATPTSSGTVSMSPYQINLAVRTTTAGVLVYGGTMSSVPARTVVEYFRTKTPDPYTAGTTYYIWRRENAPVQGSGTSVQMGVAQVISRTIYPIEVNVTSLNTTTMALDCCFPNVFRRPVPSVSGTIRSGTSRTVLLNDGVISSDRVMIRNPREDL